MKQQKQYSNKAVLFCAFLLMIFTTANAQRSDVPFDKGSKTLGFTLGVGDGENGYDDYTGDHNALPAFAVIYDQGVFANVGPGTIGIGGIISGKEAYDDYGAGYKYTWSSFLIGVRGTYHLTILADRNNKFDPYAGITVGGRFNHYHDSGSDYTSNSSDPIVAPFIGAKYNFADHIGVFAEASFDISLLRAGINFNF
jgi:hypothetical protein